MTAIASPLVQNSLWYQQAIFYELPVKAFFDSNGDGYGDFQGLTARLDYLQDLGVTCLWLLPFYPSPLRDDGFDVSDFRGVHPHLGSLEDFQQFLEAAHRRQLRVVAELVISHTSRDHAWFEAARAAPRDSEMRKFYVWRDEPPVEDRAVLPRIHWSWDEAAGAWYHHHFFDHQPDLNYTSSRVAAEMQEVLRFWLRTGLDGLCLNGAAALHVDAPHHERPASVQAILRQFRQMIEEEFPGRILEAGVNLPADQAESYFREGSCHVVPHLPLAERIFVATAEERSRPIEEVLENTPSIPPHCQWALLLRNHDELLLPQATSEEREGVLRELSIEERHTWNDGVMRRLAPLMDYQQRKIELLYSLLFSLPGAPVIYYGDEIGMGDNVTLPHRDALRAPMAWNARQNGGFSTAAPDRLYAPLNMDPLGGYASANVERQQQDSSSLYHVLRRMISCRLAHPELATADVARVETANPRVLAHVRRGSQSTFLVVANLSRLPQAVAIDLPELVGLTPVELSSGTTFPVWTRQPYQFTLVGYGFFWFQMTSSPDEPPSQRAPVPLERIAKLPTIEGAEDWQSLLQGECRAKLEKEVLPTWLRSQRWFGGKAQQVKAVTVSSRLELPSETASPLAAIVVARVEFEGGDPENYSLFLRIRDEDKDASTGGGGNSASIARLTSARGHRLLEDALSNPDVIRQLGRMVSSAQSFTANGAGLRGRPTTVCPQLYDSLPPQYRVSIRPPTSSNSLAFLGDRLLLKIFRRLQSGINPDYEIGCHLTEQGRFSQLPRVAGRLEWSEGNVSIDLGMLQELIPNQGDGWAQTLEELDRYYDRVSSRQSLTDTPVMETNLSELASQPPPLVLLETIGRYWRAVGLLGRRTAEMHVALSDPTAAPEFAPENWSDRDRSMLREGIREQAERALQTLSVRISALPDSIREDDTWLLEQGTELESLAEQMVPDQIEAAVIRVHGDYHLGQTLWTGADYVILDFEGEPTRPLQERRQKQSPLKDVAGMIRSYHYAAYAGLFAWVRDRPRQFSSLEPWASAWYRAVAAEFLRAYWRQAGDASFLPGETEVRARLLDAFMLEKAFYELSYELNNRPDWVQIPLRGILDLVQTAGVARV